MAKRFGEVFPGLQLSDSVRELFDKATVERVTASRRRDFVRVYLECDRLIGKEMIFDMEQEIRKQLFPNHEITVKIQEKFHLSAQYDLKKLMRFTGTAFCWN